MCHPSPEFEAERMAQMYGSIEIENSRDRT